MAQAALFAVCQMLLKDGSLGDGEFVVDGPNEELDLQMTHTNSFNNSKPR